VSVTLNIYAEEFDKAMHRDDLMARRAGGIRRGLAPPADMTGPESPFFSIEQTKNPTPAGFS
jgi:hypothetical protein